MSVIPTREEIPQIIRPGGMTPRRQAPASGMTGQDIFRVLRKRKWLIILFLIGTMIVTCISTAIWLMYAPIYRAEAMLLVNAPRPSDLQGLAPAYPREIMDRFVMTQLRLIKAEPILLRAMDQPDFKRTTWFRSLQPERVVPELTDQIDVAAVPNTIFISVAMSGTNRDDLPVIVNAIANAAVQDSKEATGSDRTKAIERLQEVKKTTLNEQTRIRNEITDLRTSTDVSTLQERRNVLAVRLQTYTQALIDLENQKQEAQAAVDDLDQLEKENLLDRTREAQDRLNEDPMIRALRFAQVNLFSDIEAAKQKYGPNSMQVRNMVLRQETLSRQLAETEDRVRKEIRQSVREMRRQVLATVKAKLLDIQQKFNDVDFKARDIQNVQTNLTRLMDEDTATTNSLRKIDDGLRELELLAKQEPPLALRRSATIPREPSQPRWKYMIPLGLLVGLVLSLSLAFLLESMDTSIKSPSDVTRRADLPLLGMVPHLDDIDEEIADSRLAFQTHPNSLFSEAFRHIRTNLLMGSSRTDRRRSILVTSPHPEEGRGTVAMNLAGATARAGRKVLVVDCNFQQPMIKVLFPQCSAEGLSNVLEGKAAWRDVVKQIEPNLWVMTAGPKPLNSSELLGSDHMRTVLAEMLAEYDQVLFDGAPCLVLSDSAVLGTVVDGVVMVLRAGESTAGVVHRSKEMLYRVGANILGVVLNGVRTTAETYLRKTYETYYEYHQQQPTLPGKE